MINFVAYFLVYSDNSLSEDREFKNFPVGVSTLCLLFTLVFDSK
jgi:hypothetical protein